MSFALKNQKAVVTGATAGIGKAIAKKFAQQGAHVAIIGTHPERGAAVVEEINRLVKEDRVKFYRADVSDTSAVNQTIGEILEVFNHVNVLVNNAGIARDNLLMKMAENDWDDVMAINAKSCYNTSRALVRSMMKARSGKIINVSSVVGLIGNIGQANYAASKGAVIAFTKALALELAPRNICVNCIAPGFISTRMTEALSQDKKEKILLKIPFNRLGTPDEVANAALFLASDMSDYITGQVITVDGGMVT
ncbi:MAG: 3-oxoacyl-[acyl-carrier-protein] reductase [Waddliaceae bacterium]